MPKTPNGQSVVTTLRSVAPASEQGKGLFPLRTFQAKENLLTPLEPIQCGFVVVRGKVGIYPPSAMEDGSTIPPVRELHQNAVIGAAYIDAMLREDTLPGLPDTSFLYRAVIDTDVYVIERSQIKRGLVTNLELLADRLGFLTTRLARQQESLEAHVMGLTDRVHSRDMTVSDQAKEIAEKNAERREISMVLKDAELGHRLPVLPLDAAKEVVRRLKLVVSVNRRLTEGEFAKDYRERGHRIVELEKLVDRLQKERQSAIAFGEDVTACNVALETQNENLTAMRDKTLRDQYRSNPQQFLMELSPMFEDLIGTNDPELFRLATQFFTFLSSLPNEGIPGEE